MLEVRALNAAYGKAQVLFGLDFSARAGEVLVLLGRNGAGKTTALKRIMGLLPPQSGEIRFDGERIDALPPYQIARLGLGYVPEERRIFPNLSVLDNLSMGIKRGRAAARSHATTWTVERIYRHFPFMQERTVQKGRLLSGGEQQMLAIARTLMGNPDLVLVDEPTEGLAPLVVKEGRDVLAEVNRAGVSILLVEHNLKVAMSLAHRVYLMGKAHVGFSGTVEELNARPEIRARYLEV